MIRAKFVVDSKEAAVNDPESVTVRMSAVSDKSGIPEDQQFAKATPSGSLDMAVTNEAALAQLEVGEPYYMDIYRAYPEPDAASAEAQPEAAQPEAAQPEAAQPEAEAETNVQTATDVAPDAAV